MSYFEEDYHQIKERKKSDLIGWRLRKIFIQNFLGRMCRYIRGIWRFIPFSDRFTRKQPSMEEETVSRLSQDGWGIADEDSDH